MSKAGVRAAKMGGSVCIQRTMWNWCPSDKVVVDFFLLLVINETCSCIHYFYSLLIFV